MQFSCVSRINVRLTLLKTKKSFPRLRRGKIKTARYTENRRREAAALFVDKVEISIKAGNGGNGAVSFHREKYVNAGGPDGGDGGKGSDIVFAPDDSLSTLIDFRYKKKYVAPDGEAGGAKRCSGKSMEPTVIKVPRGTIIKDAHTGRILADVSD